MKNRFWIINVHTRACYGPYDTPYEAIEEIDADQNPRDWSLVKTYPRPVKPSERKPKRRRVVK